LRAARHDLTAEPPLFEDVLFHCQQGVEKAFKAFLVWHDQPFRRTHSLEEIGQRCAEIDPSLAETVDETVPLTAYAWRFRYPGDDEPPTREESDRALVLADQALKAVLSRIPLDAHP
jgi:HEPN domain-containing protein